MKHDKPSAVLTMDRPQKVRKARRRSRFSWEARKTAVPHAGDFDVQEGLEPSEVKRKYQEAQKASKERFTGSEELWTSA